MSDKGLSLFDMLNNISNSSENLSEHEEFNKAYSSFMINRFLAMDNSTIFFANEASKMSHLPIRMQYEFLFYAINKTKRFFKYAKSKNIKSKDIDNISKYYSVNKERAIEMLDILDKKQIKEIDKFF
jgi:hypothetical protein